VIGEAMEETGRVGIGRIVLSSRERQVLVEPNGGGMLMRTLRSTNEVRRPEFGDADSHADPDMVAVAKTIIERRTGEFDPEDFHDRYQDALRQLVESKAEGRPAAKKQVAAPPKVINLMEALKRSLTEGGSKPAAKKARSGDRRQGHMLLPVEGGKASAAEKAAEKASEPAAKPRAAPSRVRKKAS